VDALLSSRSMNWSLAALNPHHNVFCTMKMKVQKAYALKEGLFIEVKFLQCRSFSLIHWFEARRKFCSTTIAT